MSEREHPRPEAGPDRTASTTRHGFLQGAAAAGVAATMATSLPGAALAATRTPRIEVGGPSGNVVWYMNLDAPRNKWATNTIIPAFKKANPTINVTLMTVPWDQFDSKLLALHASGNSPDVFAQWGQAGGAQYYHHGLLQPLDPLIQRAGWDLSRVPRNLQNYYRFDGRLYGVPMYALGTFIFYNKDLFDAAKVPYPPVDWNDTSWTWDEMVRRAKLLTKNYGQRGNAQYGFYHNFHDLYGSLWMWGAEFFPPASYKSGVAPSINLTSKEAVAAVQAKVDLIYKHRVSPTPSTYTALQGAGDPITTGKVAMTLAGGWQVWTYSGLPKFNWGIAALPLVKTRICPTFSDPWFLSAGSKNATAAFEFIKYLTTGPGERTIASALSSPPADQRYVADWLKSTPKVKPEDLKKVQDGAVAHGRENAASLINGYGQIEDIYNQMMSPVWQGRAKPADVLAQVQNKANTALQNLGKQ